MPLLSASASVRSGFAALRTNPLRTFLSALGVVIGIGAMISVLALSDGVETSMRKQLAADGRAQTLRLAPRVMEMVDGLLVPRANAPVFTLGDADALEASVAKLGTVDLSQGGQVLITVADRRQPRGAALRGSRIAPAALRDRPLAAGRFFTREEVASRAHVLVISDALAAALAASLADSTAGPVVMDLTPGRVGGPTLRNAPTGPQPSAAACRALVGRTVAIRDTPWQIVGLAPPPPDTPTQCTGKPLPARPGVGSIMGRMAATALVPVTAIADANTPRPGVTQASVESPFMVLTATRLEDVPTMRQAAERWLTSRYGAPKDSTTGGWRDRVDVSSYERESESIRQAMLVFRLLMSAITGISLVVGGVGIMNVLLATVTERTREIGISKAVGARRRDVLTQYLAESVAISAMGAVLGTVLGYGVAQVVAALMRSQATTPVHAGFSVSTMLVAVGAPLVVGLCFGMYPALRASRLSPIDAIRHE